jgi:hypothetical protein
VARALTDQRQVFEQGYEQTPESGKYFGLKIIARQ